MKHLQQLAARFEKENYGTMLVVGGAHIATSFLKEGLIDEIWLTIEPKIFGKGGNFVTEQELDLELQIDKLRAGQSQRYPDHQIQGAEKIRDDRINFILDAMHKIIEFIQVTDPQSLKEKLEQMVNRGWEIRGFVTFHSDTSYNESYAVMESFTETECRKDGGIRGGITRTTRKIDLPEVSQKEGSFHKSGQ